MTDYLIAHVGHTQKHDEHICWWKPDSCGYTVCVDKAGRYSEQEARSICASSDCMAVPFEPASALARSTPYYRRQDGTINKLYDGGPHRPVENKSECWARLKQTAVVIGKYAKPTPMPLSKQRAIYLDSDRATRSTKPVEDGWLQDGHMLYRLTDEPRPRNRDEIIVTMANSSRTEEARTRRAGELLDAIRATAEIRKATQ